MNRQDQLNQMLSASLDATGKPSKGFVKRVAAIRAELRKLETSRAVTPTNPQG